MSSFAAWGLTILGLAVISTVAEMLLPQGKMRNIIRSVMATVAVLVIVTPLPQLLKKGVYFDFTQDTVNIDTDYLAFIDGKNRDVIASAAERYLEQNGYRGVTVSVETDGYTVKSARIEFDETSITQNGEHINKSEITKLLAEYFGIEKEAVMAYG